MRIIAAFALIAVSISLGGCFCFHHDQQVFTEDLPPAPISTPPMK
jgi:hypothetical protein